MTREEYREEPLLPSGPPADDELGRRAARMREIDRRNRARTEPAVERRNTEEAAAKWRARRALTTTKENQ